jgi:hypothetical protein
VVLVVEVRGIHLLPLVRQVQPIKVMRAVREPMREKDILAVAVAVLVL